MGGGPSQPDISINNNSGNITINKGLKSMVNRSTKQELHQGDTLTSPNEEYKAIFQEDSNFVIYKNDTEVIWSTDTQGTGGSRIILQEDGRLVMFDKNDKAVWSTLTTGKPSEDMRLTLSDDGHLVLDSHGQTIWTS